MWRLVDATRKMEMFSRTVPNHSLSMLISYSSSADTANLSSGHHLHRSSNVAILSFAGQSRVRPSWIIGRQHPRLPLGYVTPSQSQLDVRRCGGSFAAQRTIVISHRMVSSKINGEALSSDGSDVKPTLSARSKAAAKSNGGIAAYFQPVSRTSDGANGENLTSLRRSTRARREIVTPAVQAEIDSESEPEAVRPRNLKKAIKTSAGHDPDSDFEILSLVASSDSDGKATQSEDDYAEASSSFSRAAKRRKVVAASSTGKARAARAGSSQQARTAHKQVKGPKASSSSEDVGGGTGRWRSHAQEYHEIRDVEELVPDLLTWFEGVR